MSENTIQEERRDRFNDALLVRILSNFAVSKGDIAPPELRIGDKFRVGWGARIIFAEGDIPGEDMSDFMQLHSSLAEHLQSGPSSNKITVAQGGTIAGGTYHSIVLDETNRLLAPLRHP